MRNTHALRIGIISTRLAGTDGVSLESAKWETALARLGHQCFFFAGECDRSPERAYVVPEAHFAHPDIQQLQDNLFGISLRASEVSGQVHTLRKHLKEHLYQFCQYFDIQLLIVENALSIPMNIPFGLALTEFIAETGIPTIAHHHDFVWERERFAVNAVADYLEAAFPPNLPSIRHVVINSAAGYELGRRTGVRWTLIPNVMDFEHPPTAPDETTFQLREALGVPEDHYLVLQPTRVVPRKRIEHAIELVRRLELKCTLMISHAAGDEGSAYLDYVRNYAEWMGVHLLLSEGQIKHERGQLPDGRPVFSLCDAYQNADLVSYPSSIEGFGNAFLEAIYYGRPLVMNTYAIFKTDIQPKGFRIIGFPGYVTKEAVQQARQVLLDGTHAAEMIVRNYELGRRYYSFRVLRQRLSMLISELTGVIS